MKEKILNTSIQEVANFITRLKKEGLCLEEIKELIFD